MAESAEDKNFVAERLDEDRQKLAIEADRWKRQWDLPGQMRSSIQRDPVPWMIGAILTGFLLCRAGFRSLKTHPTPSANPCVRRPASRLALDRVRTLDAQFAQAWALQVSRCPGRPHIFLDASIAMGHR